MLGRDSIRFLARRPGRRARNDTVCPWPGQPAAGRFGPRMTSLQSFDAWLGQNKDRIPLE